VKAMKWKKESAGKGVLSMSDVQEQNYATVIREMMRHENDVTNHRIMWLLIGQGFIANAYVSAETMGKLSNRMLPLVGLLITLSAFLMLYKSYQARGYLLFLGALAKQGALREEHLPLAGWPRKRIKGWRRDTWVCPWVERAGDILEPWLFLPSLFLFVWLTVMLQKQTMMDIGMVLLLGGILTAMIVSVFCIVLVWSQGKNEDLEI